uniref:polysaccharide deacetylase family protein n=1 Tax=Xanthomonas axonopodis TaxID=53413 RepID=UPI000A6C3798
MTTSPLHRLLLCASCMWVLALAGCGKQDASDVAVAAKPAAATNAGTQADKPGDATRALIAQLRDQLDRHCRIIVLLADEDKQTPRDRATSSSVGQQSFHENLEQRERIAASFDTVLISRDARRFATIAAVLDEVESAPDLFDADRLAFAEVLRDLHARIGRDSALPTVKLHQRIGEDLQALDEIERSYNTELTQIFSRFDRSRAIVPKREKWDDYVAHPRTLYTRETILRDHGVVEPYPFSARDSEVVGRDLPPKTVVLTFDDGLHKAYTEEIVAILKRYDVPGVFFEVGRNLGSVDDDGKAKLAPLSKISHILMKEGYAVGNHSLTHAPLSKTTGDALRRQVLDTDTLLRAVDDKRAPLFRF